MSLRLQYPTRCERRCHTAYPMNGSPTSTRFVAFSAAELAELWDGLTMDDGLRYGLSRDDPAYWLAQEIYDEAAQRGLVANAPHRWDAVSFERHFSQKPGDA